MPSRRFLPPDQHPPRDPYGAWAAVVAVVLLFWVVFVVAFLPRDAAADHDGADQPWRRPLLEACAATWDYTSTRVTVDAPGHPQHGRSLHEQPWPVRDIFYRTWFRDTEDERAVDAHLIQWRREYECTHPKGVALTPVPAMVTAGGRLPRGGGGPIFVDRGTARPPGYSGPGNSQGPQEHRHGRSYRWHCHEGVSPGRILNVVTAAGWRIDGETGHADGLCNPGLSSRSGDVRAERTWHAHHLSVNMNKEPPYSDHCHHPWREGDKDIPEDAPEVCVP